MQSPTTPIRVRPRVAHACSGRGPARARALAPPAAVLGVVMLAAFLGCSSPETLPAIPDRDPTQRVHVGAPTVDLDLHELRERGALRVMLRNSSSSYYFLRGEEYGFEFELAREIARALDLRLEVVLPDSVYSPIDALNLGLVDVVAMPVRGDALPPSDVALTRAYDTAQPVLVTRTETAAELRGEGGLAGCMIAVRRTSAGAARLFDLRREGVSVGLVMHSPATSVEELLDQVAEGTYEGTVATDRELAAVLRFHENLAETFTLGEHHALRWIVRSNAPHLLAAVNRQLVHHYRSRGEESHKGSEFYNVVRRRYFGDDGAVHRHATDPFRLSRTGRVSPYDDLFRATADSFGIDWRLLASMAFQESRFDPEAVSWAGAVGIMQVLPSTAGLPEPDLQDAPTNIAVGARHLRWLLDRYDYMVPSERLRFAIAAYNCGHGHLDDARMLSVRRGLDPDVWAGSVRESLLLLRKPRYHREARYGYVRGHETVGYVRDVLNRYAMLRRLTDEREGLRFSSAFAPTSPGATR